MKLLLLGTPQVVIDDVVVTFGRRKTQALLYFLADTSQPYRRNTLAAMFWPDSNQKRAHDSLRRHLSDMNKTLTGDWLSKDREQIALESPQDLWVDVKEFEKTACRIQDMDPAKGAGPALIQQLEEGVGLYRDDFLTGFTLPDSPSFDEWQFFRSEELRRTLSTLLKRLIDELKEQDRWERAIPYARQWLTLDTLHEPAHRQLMRLYMSSGQQSAAIRQFRRCEQLLNDEFGVAPDVETVALYESIHKNTTQRDPQRTRTHPNPVQSQRPALPTETTPFIGRKREVAELTELLHDPGVRLVTILGPGGMGKTRLALEVAHNLESRYEHYVCFVSLVSVQTEAQLVDAISDAIDLQIQPDDRSPRQQLLDFLQGRQMLLVLDNFEQLIDEASLVNDLLKVPPHLDILVTSREQLQLSSETIYTLGGMDAPDPAINGSVTGNDAVQLFVQAAQRVQPHFEVENSDLGQVAEICRLVGGMPLGILMAATWMELLTPADIVDELSQGLDLLETEYQDLPERQRSMRSLLVRSWTRLTEDQRSVFMRLTVYKGGFNRHAAASVAGATLPILRQLAIRSFVQRRSDDRYDIHELLRQYGAERLAEAGQADAVNHEHSVYYLDFVHQQEEALAGRQQIDAVSALESDLENVRAAWYWAIDQRMYNEVDGAIEALFRWFWMLHRGRQRVGAALFGYAEEMWTLIDMEKPLPAWGRLLARSMEFEAPWLMNASDTRIRIDMALTIARQQGDTAEIAFCLWAQGLTAISEWRDNVKEQGTVDVEQPCIGYRKAHLAAIKAYSDSLDMFRGLSDQFYEAQVLENLGQCYRFVYELDQAIPLLQESQRIRRSQGDRFGLARSLRELGWGYYVTGHERNTVDAWQEALEIRSSLGDLQGILDSLFNLSLISLTKGDWRNALETVDREKLLISEINNLWYRHWIDRKVEIAACMESAEHLYPTTLYPVNDKLTAFNAMLMHCFFGSTVSGIRNNLLDCIALVADHGEKAICLCLAALVLVEQGTHQRAIKYLALANTQPQVAKSWIGLLPEIVALRKRLRVGLSQDEFDGLWHEGQRQDIDSSAIEL